MIIALRTYSNHFILTLQIQIGAARAAVKRKTCQTKRQNYVIQL